MTSLNPTRRKLVTGYAVQDSSLGKQTFSIHTKCPDKWLLVDLETGDIWHANRLAYSLDDEGEPTWKRPPLPYLKALFVVVQNALRLLFVKKEG
jgi:hypothetical protein